MIHSLWNCLGASDPFPVENQIMLCPVCFKWTKTIKTLNEISRKSEYTQYLISKPLAKYESQHIDAPQSIVKEGLYVGSI